MSSLFYPQPPFLQQASPLPMIDLSSTSSVMAVFEVDPTPWLPKGHQVIDGGPTRLPRTFYSGTQDLQHQHQAFCIGIVEPPPPQQSQALWRDQVWNILIGPLNRKVVDVQPSMFGTGLYQLSGPNVVNAVLVQHGRYNMNNHHTCNIPIRRTIAG
jgi:hypothetical protein